jgi:transposase
MVMPGDADPASAQAIIAHQVAQIRSLEERIATLEGEVQGLSAAHENDQARIASMYRRIRQMQRQLYGPSSEGYHADEQTVSDLRGKEILPEPDDKDEPEESAASTPPVTPAPPAKPSPPSPAAESAADRDDAPGCSTSADSSQPQPDAAGSPGAEALTAPTPPLLTPKAETPTTQRRKPGGRLTIPTWLDKDVDIIDIPESERLGADGQPLPCIDQRITEKLDFVPAHFRCHRTIRLIYGVPFGDEPRLIAPVPPSVVAKGLPTDRLVAQVVADKFDLHLPLYRQEGQIQVLGLPLTRATLDNWVAKAAIALAPIHVAIGAQVLAQPVLGLDDTYLPVLKPGKGRCHQGRLWGYLSGDDFFCEYQATREGRWPAAFLAGYRGTVLGDAYSGHIALFTTGIRTPAGCMSHARRKFEAALKLGETQSKSAMDHFAALYAVERSVADSPPEEILAARKAQSVGIMDKLQILLEGLTATELPSSATAIAATYTLKIFPQLRQFTKDGRVPIDNNALERCWRGVGIGRRNWLFAGSADGGTWAATLISICQSCRLVGLNVRTYLVEVFAALHAGRKDYAQLTPSAWAARLDAAAPTG